MELDLVFIVSYECPGCRLMLEDRSGGVPAWHRCPKCGRPSLAPDHQNWNRSSFRSETKPTLDTGTYFIEEELPIRPRSMAPLPSSTGQTTSNLFLSLGIGFFASIFLCIVSLLNGNSVFAWITGLAAVICFLLLVVPIGRTPPG